MVHSGFFFSVSRLYLAIAWLFRHRSALLHNGSLNLSLISNILFPIYFSLPYLFFSQDAFTCTFFVRLLALRHLIYQIPIHIVDPISLFNCSVHTFCPQQVVAPTHLHPWQIKITQLLGGYSLNCYALQCLTSLYHRVNAMSFNFGTLAGPISFSLSATTLDYCLKTLFDYGMPLLYNNSLLSTTLWDGCNSFLMSIGYWNRYWDPFVWL